MNGKKRNGPSVQVFEGLSLPQTVEAFLDGLRRSGDLVTDPKTDLMYWFPNPRVEQVFSAWHLRMVAIELDKLNAPVEAELRRKGLM